jgi:hypothetical protein
MVAVRKDHFALAPMRTFRNLSIMRACFKQLLFILALAGVFGFTRVAEAQFLKTNSITLGKAGTLQVLTPPDWKLNQVDLKLQDNLPVFDLHAPSNSLVIRLYVRWDGFAGNTRRPGESEMGIGVSNSVVQQYLPVAVEKTFDLEKLHGPAVMGIYARVTDSKWSPVLKDNYPNICEGMFRCANIWGNFNLLTYDKDGPGFKTGMRILESMRRAP